VVGDMRRDGVVKRVRAFGVGRGCEGDRTVE